MRYMIDFHGVLNKNSKFFKNFLSSLIKGDNKIYICSGGRSLDIEKKLDQLGYKINIHYHYLISLSDFIEENLPSDEIEYDINNNVWVDDAIWWSLKAEFCKKYKIDAFFDDSEEYFIYMPKDILQFHIR